MHARLLLLGHSSDSVLLTEFLLRREWQVEQCGEVDRAVELIDHRARQRQPYLVCMLDTDAFGKQSLAVIAAIRAVACDLQLIALVDFARVAELQAAVFTAGCQKIFEKPVDFSQLDSWFSSQSRIIAAGVSRPGTTSSRRRPPALGNEYMPTTGPHQRGGQLGLRPVTGKVVAPPEAEVDAGSGYRRSNSSYRRADSGGYGHSSGEHGPGSPEPTPFFGTSRLSHSEADRQEFGGGTDAIARPDSSSWPLSTSFRRRRSLHDSSQQPPSSGKVRRSVTGRVEQAPPVSRAPGVFSEPIDPQAIAAPPEATKKVACAHCQRTFRVLRKTEAYTMPCIHCGNLNRIMP